jgi:hypothetical protein
LAFRFRAEGARLSRAKEPGFTNLYFNPSITLATRVRIEVLRALASRVTNTRQLSYCVHTGPRPKLSTGPCAGFPGRRTSLNYTQAIKKYGYLLEDQFLDKAYARAQMFFSGELFGFLIHAQYDICQFIAGELERTFLVLREVVALRRQAERDSDSGGVPGAQPEADAPSRGQKRTGDDDGSDPKRVHV